MTEIAERLTQIATQAETAVIRAPASADSPLREAGERLADAAGRMARILRVSPDIVPTLKAARFATSAEGASKTLATLIALRGGDADREAAQAEADLLALVGTLAGVADTARRDAIRALRSDIETGTDLVRSWHDPDLLSRPVVVSEAQDGVLVSAFRTALDATALPAVVERPKFRFWPLRKADQTPSAPKVRKGDIGSLRRTWEWQKAHQTAEYGADLLRHSVQMAAEQETEERRSFRDSRITQTGRVRGPVLDAYGLHAIADSRQNTLMFSLSGEPPQTETQLWRRLAKFQAGDPEALRRALLFKADPEFRTALRKAVVEMLSKVETQGLAGVPLPHAPVCDPVVRAALTATLSAMGAGELRQSADVRPYADPDFDPFSIRKGLVAAMGAAPGITLAAFEDGACVMTTKSVEVPTGLAAAVHAAVDKMPVLRHPQGALSVVRLPGQSVRVDPQALSVVEDLPAHILRAMRAYDQFRRKYYASPLLTQNAIVCVQDPEDPTRFCLDASEGMSPNVLMLEEMVGDSEYLMGKRATRDHFEM